MSRRVPKSVPASSALTVLMLSAVFMLCIPRRSARQLSRSAVGGIVVLCVPSYLPFGNNEVISYHSLLKGYVVSSMVLALYIIGEIVWYCGLYLV